MKLSDRSKSSGEAGSGEALHVIGNADVEMVIVDISLKGMARTELTRRLKERNPDLRVWIVSMHSGTYYIRAALSPSNGLKR